MIGSKMLGSVSRWCLNRLFEWVMTFALLGLGLWLYVFPRSIEASAFRYILDIVGSANLTAVFLFVGWFRILALVANGKWPVWGPRIRAAAALAAAALWLQMDIALIKIVPEIGTPPSPGIPVYTAIVFGEIIATFMAAADDRSRIR